MLTANLTAYLRLVADLTPCRLHYPGTYHSDDVNPLPLNLFLGKQQIDRPGVAGLGYNGDSAVPLVDKKPSEIVNAGLIKDELINIVGLIGK